MNKFGEKHTNHYTIRPLSTQASLAKPRIFSNASLEFVVDHMPETSLQLGPPVQLQSHGPSQACEAVTAVNSSGAKRKGHLDSSIQRAAHFFTVGDLSSAQKELQTITAYGGADATAALRAVSSSLRKAAQISNANPGAFSGDPRYISTSYAQVYILLCARPHGRRPAFEHTHRPRRHDPSL